MKIFAFAFFIFIALSISAQKIDIAWGNVAKANGPLEAYFVAGHDATGSYIVNRRYFNGGKIFLNKFDLNNNIIYTKELKMPLFEKKDVDFVKLCYFNGKLVLLSTKFNKSSGKSYAYLSTVGLDGEVNKDIKKADSVNAEYKWNPGEFNCSVTDDGSKFVLFHNEPYRAESISLAGMYDRRGNERFTIRIFDKNLNSIWKKNIMLPIDDVTIPHNAKDFDIKKYFGSRGDLMYILGGKEESNAGEDYNKKVYIYYLFKYDLSKNEELEYVLDVGNKYVSNVAMQLDNENRLVCVGFYSNTSAFIIAGIFCERLDGTTMETVSKAFRIFNDATIEMMKPLRTKNLTLQAGKSQSGISLMEYKIHEIVEREDGSYIMTSEQYEADITNQAANSQYKTYDYTYSNIFVARIKPTGEVDWTTIIPKYQVSANEGGLNSSFAACVGKEKVYLIYNDAKENVGQKYAGKIQEINTTDKKVPVVAMIDAEGIYYEKKELQINKKNNEMSIRPKISYKTGSNKLEIIAVDGNKFILGTVVFD